MAVSKKQSERNIQSLIQQGVPESFVRANIPGAKLNPKEAQALLAKYQASANNVFSTSNIQSNVPKPDDLLGIRSQIQQELGIPGLQEQYQQQFAGLQKFDVATTEQQRQIEEQTVGMNVIRGAQAAALRLRAQERTGLASALSVSQSQLQAAQQEAQFRFAVREQEVSQKRELILKYPGAGITFGDSFETISTKLRRYEISEEERIRDQAKKDAFDELYLSTFGTDRGKLSRREAKKKLKKRFGKDRDYEEALRSLELEKGELQLEALRADMANVKSGGKGGGGGKVSGGYTPQEERKLRAAGIDPNNIEVADDYLYGSGLTPEQKKLAKYEDSIANSVTTLMDGNVPLGIIEDSVRRNGYELNDIASAYDIDIENYEQERLENRPLSQKFGDWLNNLWK